MKTIRGISKTLSLISKMWLYLGFFLIILMLIGCASKPSEADARKAYEDKNAKLFKEGVIRINSFKKVNAIEGELFGVKFYKIEYDAEVEFLKDYIIGDAVFGGVRVEKGRITKLKGKYITFIKTEKGWKADNDQIEAPII
ncbi:MAG: hypothetical protein QMD44_10915 [Thermodesulfovibrionales bacterium]|jgi:hypothetical protein|nr:hypothetical protein [Thermodesulfovibrionales bacterium]